MNRYLKIDPRLINRRLNRVGIISNRLFVHPMSETSIEIWSVDSLYPSSWTCLFNISVSSLIYCIPTFSYDLPYIYVFFGGIEDDTIDDDFQFILYRMNYETMEVKNFRLFPSRCKPALFDLPLETISLRCGAKNKLVIFDRSIVMGPIPFWDVYFDETDQSFHFERDDIEEEKIVEIEEGDADDERRTAHCSRFPIPFDAPNRIFGRLKDDGSMMIYSPAQKIWLQYSLTSSDIFDLPPTTVRGIRETYGRNGRRMGAVESPLTFHPDSNGICVAKLVKNDHRHYFYQVLLDHESHEFSCSPRGSVRLEEGVEKMFYTLCSPDVFVFLGIRIVAVVSLQPARLEDTAVWQVQKSSRQHLTKAEIKELCKIVYNSKILLHNIS